MFIIIFQLGLWKGMSVSKFKKIWMYFLPWAVQSIYLFCFYFNPTNPNMHRVIHLQCSIQSAIEHLGRNNRTIQLWGHPNLGVQQARPRTIQANCNRFLKPRRWIDFYGTGRAWVKAIIYWKPVGFHKSCDAFIVSHHIFTSSWTRQ